ncbi:protein kinase domain-containing protein [Neorhodopirellula pilleata]|uniref:Serine/threonine-protein kinase Pkn1 n=1 Tax=Neorhodopirellula pilleata TaxID=2714738 RepID=A0A5C6APP0_9BACT|nr:protein kinase [Neorhodopirellula pilleata]TWU01670.1 Serine/threonine-protein kinase Pkn1 [Neorhodopirellula pilleata]
MNEVESLLDEFESAWIAGKPVSIDQFMRQLIDGNAQRLSVVDRDELLAELVRLEFEYRYNADPQSPPVVEEYLRRFPQLQESSIAVDLAEDARRLSRRHSAAEATDPMHTIVTATRPTSTNSAFNLLSGQKLPTEEIGTSQSLPGSLADLQFDDLWAGLHPRFRREAVLGEGSFGVVHRAFDTQLQRHVAIKTLHPILAADPERRGALVEEARRVAQFDHPNLVTVYDVVDGDHPSDDQARNADQQGLRGGVHLVMQLVDGLPMDSWWAQTQSAPSPLDSTEADYRVLASLMAQVSRAVHHAHLAGCIHCDLKPQNILVDRRGNPTVLDFGLSIRRSEQGSLAGRIFGTPAYMSPEQTWGENHHLDGRSDIWSLGAILYRLLTGRLPFEAASTPAILESIQTRVVTPPGQWSDQVPDKLSRICLRCLSKRIEDRYETAAQLASDLQSYADENISRTLHPGGRSQSSYLKNCPFTETDLVGRDELIESAVAMLTRSKERLLTLTGSGGIGKTQTAVAIVHRLDQSPSKPTDQDSSSQVVDEPLAKTANLGDILWVDTANATTGEQFAAAVLAGLGVAQQPDEPSSQRVEQSIAVRGPLMCVLDNVEQVIDEAAALVQRWLVANPDLRLIVTSQLPLQIANERVIVLPPLSTAPPSDDVDGLDGFDDQSSELFVRRAKAASPSFQVDASGRQTIRQIGELLDGNPLAIELAASRVGVLTLDDLLRRLTRSFGVLKNRRADRPDRHQSLTHVVGWSIDLLTSTQTEALRRLALWPAPIPMSIAEGLLESDFNEESNPAIGDDEDSLDVLDELRRRSLLRFRSDDEVMHVHADNTIRRYLSERIDPVHRREVAFAMLTQLSDYVKSNDGMSSHAAIDRQHLATNLSIAVAWLDESECNSDMAVEAILLADRLAADQLDSRLRIDRIESVQPHDESFHQAEWTFRLADARRLAGQTDEAESLCRRQLSRAERQPESDTAKDLRAITALGEIAIDTRKLLARILFRTGRTTESVRLLEQVVSLDQDVDARLNLEPSWQLDVILELIEYERRLGHFERAESWLTRGNAIAETLPGAVAMRTGLIIQEGKLALQRGRINESRNYFDQAVQSCTTLNREPEYLQQALLGRAAAAAETGDFDAAELDYDRCERISRRLGDLPTLAQSLNNRALAADDSGDPARAHELLQQAYEIYRNLGDRVGIAICRCAQASAQLSMNQPQLAIELLNRTEVTDHLPGESIHQAIRHGDLGVAYQQTGDLDRAKQSLSQCLAELDRLNIESSAERLIYQVPYFAILDQQGQADASLRQQVTDLVNHWRSQPHLRKRVDQTIQSFEGK